MISNDSNKSRILIISDGTGETAKMMLNAAMVQFADQDVSYMRYKNIRTKEQIEALCEQANRSNDLIVYTIVSPKLRAYLRKSANEKSVPIVDLLGPLLIGLAHYFRYKPKLIAGLLHNVNERYFERIDAIEYTVAHDDGKDLRDLNKADLLLLGISRTSKTPLSMYLSHYGWKVANIPIIKDFKIPKEIFEINPKKVICLTIDPENLATIRRSRLKRLGQEQGGNYADIKKVNEEIEYANELFKKNKQWTVFNVTAKALEETATDIQKIMAARKLTPIQIIGNVQKSKED